MGTTESADAVVEIRALIPLGSLGECFHCVIEGGGEFYHIGPEDD